MEGTQKKKSKFTKKQLRASQGLLTQQAKTNIYCNQTGMTAFGAVRHGKDIHVKELYEEGADDEYPTDEEDVKPVYTRPSRRVEKPAEPTPPPPEPVASPTYGSDEDEEEEE